MNEPPPPHLFVVPPEPSTEVEELRAELERQRADNLILVRQGTEMGATIAGLNHTIEKQGREIIALRGENTKLAKASPDARMIEGLLEFWRDQVRGPKSRIDFEPDDKRWKVMRAAVRRGHTEPWIRCPKCHAPDAASARGQRCTVEDELKEAIMAVALFPNMADGGRRVPMGTPRSTRRDEVDNCVGDEVRIQRNRLLYRRTIETTQPSRLLMAWRAATAHADAILDTYWQALARLEQR